MGKILKTRKLTTIGEVLIVVIGLAIILTGVYFYAPVKTKLAGKTQAAANTSYELVLTGSNTIGGTLAPELVKNYLTETGCSEIIVTELNSDEKEIAYQDNGTAKKILVKAHGSGDGFKDLIADPSVVVMSSRAIKDEEKTSLASLGDLTAKNSEYVLGLDGIAIIVNDDCPIDKLDKSVLQKIFSGEIKDWSEISTKSGKINLYSRDEQSGTYDGFVHMVLGSKKMASDVVRLSDSKELVDKITQDNNGIGFVSMSYGAGVKKLSISDGTKNYLMPNKLTVATEDYPLSRKLYFYINPKNTNKTTTGLIKFILSKNGQAVLGEQGFVEFTQKEMTDKPYSVLPSDVKRLSINFRFKVASMELDNKALIDIGRLVETPDIATSEIYLVGFADADGNDIANKELSRNRAESVKAELANVGIKVTKVIGLGKEFPVASNETEEGKQKNRRVEIWVKK